MFSFATGMQPQPGQLQAFWASVAASDSQAPRKPDRASALPAMSVGFVMFDYKTVHCPRVRLQGCVQEPATPCRQLLLLADHCAVVEDAAGLLTVDFALQKYGHDWSLCPCAHPNEKTKRRSPRTYNYASVVCPEMKEVSTLRMWRWQVPVSSCLPCCCGGLFWPPALYAGAVCWHHVQETACAGYVCWHAARLTAT